MPKYNLQIFFIALLITQIKSDDIAPCSPQLKECPTIAITIDGHSELCVICPNGQQSLCPCTISVNSRIYASPPDEIIEATTTIPTKIAQTTIGSQVSIGASSNTSNNSSRALDFGLIVGITVTTFAFLIIVLVTLIIFLVRNNRKAKQLKMQKETLELDLKLKTTMTLSALLNQSNVSPPITPTTTPLQSINLNSDLQSRLDNSTAASTPNAVDTLLLPPPLDYSNMNNQVYYDYDSQQARSNISNNTNNEQANESIIIETNALPLNFVSPDITGEKIHYNSDGIGLSSSRSEALPTYNSIFRQLSEDL